MRLGDIDELRKQLAGLGHDRGGPDLIVEFQEVAAHVAHGLQRGGCGICLLCTGQRFSAQLAVMQRITAREGLFYAKA